MTSCRALSIAFVFGVAAAVGAAPIALLLCPDAVPLRRQLRTRNREGWEQAEQVSARSHQSPGAGAELACLTPPAADNRLCRLGWAARLRFAIFMSPSSDRGTVAIPSGRAEPETSRAPRPTAAFSAPLRC